MVFLPQNLRLPYNIYFSGQMTFCIEDQIANFLFFEKLSIMAGNKMPLFNLPPLRLSNVHRSDAIGQLVWKGQPAVGSAGLGKSPCRRILSVFPFPTTGLGMAERSAFAVVRLKIHADSRKSVLPLDQPLLKGFSFKNIGNSFPLNKNVSLLVTFVKLNPL